MSNWFINWFDTPYYHALYNNRNEAEANAFIDALLTHIAPLPGATFCDVACGKGRHAKRINEHGFASIGLDLAPNSIKEANVWTNPQLQFYVHDMRQGFGANRFNYVTNLFTSFGYFTTLNDNLKVLRNIHNALKPNGMFIIDFINVTPVLNTLPIVEQKHSNGYTFNITKQHIAQHIVKNIEVIDGTNKHNYQEQLQAITYNDLTALLTKAGFGIESVFGNYTLDIFDEQSSPRLIIVANKK
jgi:2-polyprenyl-3-methyl-5-hydroxy-6-metoxy-1,4-benzoquinol methylase